LRALEFGWKAFIDRKQRWIARCLRSIEMQANGNRRGLYSTLKASNGSIEAARRAGESWPRLPTATASGPNQERPWRGGIQMV
jgi:hypothetical protein